MAIIDAHIAEYTMSLHASVRTQSLFVFLSILLLLVPSVLVASAAPTGPLPVQPQLLTLAQEAPDLPVRIIVQKTDPALDLASQVDWLGGMMVSDLSIINAAVAELPAGAVPKLARTQGVRWISLDGPTVSAANATETVFTTWATALGSSVENTFVDAANMVDEAGLGPDGLFGHGSRKTKGGFTGFEAEITPGHAIQKVEVLLYVYAQDELDEDLKLYLVVGGRRGKPVTVKEDDFDSRIGPDQTGLVAVDVTRTRKWSWADFENGIEIVLDHKKFKNSDVLFYDAVGLRVTSAPGVDSIPPAKKEKPPKGFVDTSKLVNIYPQVIRATDVWNEAPAYLQGQDVTVAVVDSGIGRHKSLAKRRFRNINFNEGYHDSKDRYGHGTFVAAILASDGKHLGGKYLGVAPRSYLLNLRVSDDQGMATESTVIEALQWALENKDKYNIRVVNLSLNAAVPQSYHTSPLDAAVEILWFNGIVVVVSAGNNGDATLYPPANDPFVITVGATDDRGTLSMDDDVMASFSAYGVTEAGTVKPEIVAPGRNIVAELPGNDKLTMGEEHPSNRVDKTLFRMSGTSMSAPMVAGAVALLLESEPNLTPDQVKYRLMATANADWPGYDPAKAGAGYLDIYAAVHGTTTESANTGIQASQLLWSGDSPVEWDSVNWNSVNWNSVNWNSVNWNSVNWNSVNWNSDYWGD